MKGEKFAKTLLLLGCPQRPTTAYNIDTKRLRIRPYITRSNGKKEGKKRSKSTISQILRDFRNLTYVIGFSRSETQRHKHKQGFQYWSDDVEVTTSDRHRVLPTYPTLQMKEASKVCYYHIETSFRHKEVTQNVATPRKWDSPMLFFNIQTDYTRKRWGDSNEQTDIKNRCNATHHSPQRNQMSPAVFKQRNVAQFHTIRPKRKEPLIKAGSHNRDTHTHRQQLFTKAKKNPTDTIVHGRKRTSNLRQQAKLVPDRPRDCCHAATPTKNPLTDRYLYRRYRILSQRPHSRGEGLLYHAKKSSIYHKRAPKQTVLFVCLFVCLPTSPKKTETKRIPTLPT